MAKGRKGNPVLSRFILSKPFVFQMLPDSPPASGSIFIAYRLRDNGLLFLFSSLSSFLFKYHHYSFFNILFISSILVGLLYFIF